MDFSDALRAIKAGHRVARKGWNGKGMWIALGSSDTRERNVPTNALWSAHAAQLAEQNGGFARVAPYILMRDAEGRLVMGWLASQTDLLSDDWEDLDAGKPGISGSAEAEAAASRIRSLMKRCESGELVFNLRLRFISGGGETTAVGTLERIEEAAFASQTVRNLPSSIVVYLDGRLMAVDWRRSDAGVDVIELEECARDMLTREATTDGVRRVVLALRDTVTSLPDYRPGGDMCFLLAAP